MKILNLDVELEVISKREEYIITNETEGTLIDLTNVFRRCVEDTILIHNWSRCLGGVELNTRELMYDIKDKNELSLFYKFLMGDLEDLYDEEQFINLLLSIWEQNETFRLIAENVEQRLADPNHKLEEELKVFRNYHNPIKITNLNSYYRFKIAELFIPVKNAILNGIRRPIQKTNNPLVKYIDYTDLEVEVGVIVGGAVYKAKTLECNPQFTRRVG